MNKDFKLFQKKMVGYLKSYNEKYKFKGKLE